jgi:glycosyltransferase involved in cell wall biosynthesis
VEQSPNQTAIKRIAFIGNYLPRQCGIATFTTDLCEAIAAEHSDTTCIAVPVNDVEDGYSYPPRVRFELTEKDLESYRRAADFLNINSVDLVCLQFEYGIFGGRAGSHILALLRDLRVPIVTTLHTILREPDAQGGFVAGDGAPQVLCPVATGRVVVSIRDRAPAGLQPLRAPVTA